jgi:5-methylcytosine-specific restriction endonuclease McrA
MAKAWLIRVRDDHRHSTTFKREEPDPMTDYLSLTALGNYYDCAHQRLSELRARSVANGSIQYRQQCLDCGRPVGNPVAKGLAYDRNGGHPPSSFDEVLLADRLAGLRERREAERAERRVWYNDYLQSEQWQERRRLVFKRANFLCEGCRRNRAIHVHHLSYEHVGDEFLWELVAICEACHDRAHGAPDASDQADLSGNQLPRARHCPAAPRECGPSPAQPLRVSSEAQG